MNNEEKKSPDEKKKNQKRKAAIASERSETILFSEQKSTEAIVLSKGNSMECKVRVISTKKIGGYHRYYGEFNRDKIEKPMEILFEKYCDW